MKDGVTDIKLKNKTVFHYTSIFIKIIFLSKFVFLHIFSQLSKNENGETVIDTCFLLFFFASPRYLLICDRHFKSSARAFLASLAVLQMEITQDIQSHIFPATRMGGRLNDVHHVTSMTKLFLRTMVLFLLLAGVVFVSH